MIILTFWETLKDRITTINWGNFVAFIIGIGVGFVLCLLCYILVVLVDIKKEEKKAQKVVIKVDDEVIDKIIKNEKNRYKLESKGQKASEKLAKLKECCQDLIIDIAKTYYPESNHPVYEISVEELIALDYYIMEKLEKLFNRHVIRRIKSLRLVKIMNFIDKTKVVTDNKVVKETSKHAKRLWTALNFINPIYWGKRAVKKVSTGALLNKIVLVIIDIVGNETSKVYSKSVFVEDDDEYIEKELEKIMEGEEDV